MSKRVLLDVDGVLCDFIGRTFSDLAKYGGPAHTADDLKDWDIHHLLGTEHDALLEHIWHAKDFVTSLDPYPGAAEGIDRLRTLGHEVYFVTTAMHTAEHWVWERCHWLKKHMGARGNDILFVAHKHIVEGDMLIDDKPSNVERWDEHHPRKLAVLWDQPWNRAAVTHPFLLRTSNWEYIAEMAEYHKT